MVAVLGMVAVAEDADRLAERGPDVVEVHAGGHHADDDLEGAGRRDLDLLDLEGVDGLALALLPDDPCGHGLGQFSGLGLDVGDLGQIDGHQSSWVRLRRGAETTGPPTHPARRKSV